MEGVSDVGMSRGAVMRRCESHGKKGKGSGAFGYKKQNGEKLLDIYVYE